MAAVPETPEPSRAGESDAVPSLPALPPILPAGQPVQPLDARGPAGGDAPFLPPARRSVPPPPAEPTVFDAKAMVEAQKHFVASPVYGAIPTATAEGLVAAQALRLEAKRIRRRNRTFGWSVVVALIGGVSAAGLLAYRAYQSDQDRQAAARAERAAASEAGGAPTTLPGALTPLGAQTQIVEVLDDVNSADAAPSAGGLLDAVADAQGAIDGINGANVPDYTAAAPDVLDAALLEPIVRLGTHLDDLDGFERYVVDAQRWAVGSPETYAEFVAAAQSLPRSEAGSNGFAVLPTLHNGEIGVAIRRDDAQLVAVVISSSDPEIHVVMP